MRLMLLAAILLVSACGSGGSSVADDSDVADTELPFQSYSSPPQPRGGECDDSVDTDAPIIANGFGSKLGGIHWGMALDASRIYVAATDFEIDTSSGALEDLMPAANPGIYALELATGALVWEIHPQRDYQGLLTPVLFSASLSLTNDVLFAGSLDGFVSAFAVADGRELWSFDTAVTVNDINNIAGAGGTIDSVGVVVAGDGILVNSGYGTLFGGVGRYQAGAGNTLFVLNLPNKP